MVDLWATCFKPLAILCGCTARFVVNPNRFSYDTAQMVMVIDIKRANNVIEQLFIQQFRSPDYNILRKYLTK